MSILVRSLLCLLFASAFAQPALACALAWKTRGYAVTLAEEALITWNPTTHVEHFVRRARFEADKPDLGFLVPTPTVPTLSAVDESIFTRLNGQIQPVERERTDWYLSLLQWLLRPSYIGSAERAKATALASVEVIEQKQVAGYEASVLRAGDASELRRWLQNHGYAVRAGLDAWLAPYLKKHWAITAFKLSKSSPDAGLGLQAIDMRFLARRPFYPYREPLDGANDPELGQASPERSLRVYVLAPGALNGVYTADKPRTYRDQAQTDTLQGLYGFSGLLYAAPLTGDQTKALLGTRRSSARLIEDLPPAPWLNAWLDQSHRRPDPLAAKPRQLAELYFYPARRQTPYLPIKLKLHNIVLPLDLLALGGVVVWLLRRRRRSTV